MLRINVHKNKIQLAAATLLVFIGVTVTPHVHADELVISGNGSDSHSEVKVDSAPQTTVQQSSDAHVNNDVKVTENTGDNKTSDNSGGSNSISTGNASSSTSISNSANSSSVSVQNCNCSSNSSVSISGNGAYSHNKSDINSGANNSITVNQNAYLTNSVDENLNTGRNSANDNTNGDVSISTGDISAKKNIWNSLINFSDIAIPGGPLSDFLATIFGNGAHSHNKLNLADTTNNTIAVNNTANIINELKERYNTGDNKADGNTGGDVAIATGYIASETTVVNEANVSKVKIECGCVTPTPTSAPSSSTSSSPTPTPGSSTSTSTSSSSSTSPTSAPTEQVLGASAILPVTGSNLFFFMLIGNVVMLLTGAYLRLRAGRSPGLTL